MTDTNREMTKREANVTEGAERTSPRRVFKPDVDIIEEENETVLTADLPGVDDKSLDITLEKNILTIKGQVDLQMPAGCRLVYGEYEVGDYERSFTLSDEVDKDQIQATIKNGVLKLVLPKAVAAKARKIAITAAA